MTVRKASWLVILFFLVEGCSYRIFSPQPDSCNCCATTYTTIHSAQQCLSATEPTKSTADERLILIAFVSKNVKVNQALGWNIIHDQEIIKAAKRKYLLVTLDMNNFRGSPELIEIISKFKKGPVFIIVNQSLYPFANWGAGENKDYIISRLGNGNGP